MFVLTEGIFIFSTFLVKYTLEMELPPRDFSKNTSLPGTLGNPFDVILHKLEDIQRIHPIFYLVMIIGMSFLFGRFDRDRSITLLVFIIIDWILLAALPVFGKSFGPPQPPTLMLAFMRGFFMLILPFPPAIILQIIGVVLVVWGFWLEPHKIHITRETLTTKKMPEGQCMRLLHLGDLHIERITKREIQLQRCIDMLKPDIICFSGDILNLSFLHDETAHSDAHKVISGWQAPLGVFGVSGSPAVDLIDIFPSLVGGTPLRWLNNQSELLSPNPFVHVRITGLTCTHNPNLDIPSALELTNHSISEEFTVLLYHSPDIAPALVSTGVDLQLSGHTHGGQVRLPFFGALLTGSLYGRSLQSGRYALAKLTLYITRGLGLEGAGAPRVRLLCPPEIIIWEIKGTGTITNN